MRPTRSYWIWLAVFYGGIVAIIVAITAAPSLHMNVAGAGGQDGPVP